MEFINLHVSVLDSDQFKGATPTQRATWLCLMRYLVGQEDGDTIEKCRGWSDRKWQQVCAVTLQEVDDVCELWKWAGDDLEVNFYPEQAERETKAKRRGGVIGNRRRWGKKRHTESHTESDSDKDRESLGTSVRESTTKRNETKRNETPPAEEENSKRFAESVSDAVVFAFARTWPGEPASRAPVMPEAFVADWLSRINGRREWPRDWKRHLVADWRVRFRTWQGDSEKKCATRHGDESTAQRRYRLDKEMEGLKEQYESLASIGGDTREVDAEIERVEKGIKELEA
jgi:hypothetical protein